MAKKYILFLLMVSPLSHAVVFNQSILPSSFTLENTDSAVFSLDVNALTGYDVSGGQLIVQNAVFSFSYDQSSYLNSQDNTATFTGESTPTSWDLTYEIPPVVFDGVAYSIVGNSTAYTFYDTDSEAASGTYDIAGADSGNLSFTQFSTSTFNHTEHQIAPEDADILLQTHYYDRYTNWYSSASESAGFDLLSLMDADGILQLTLHGAAGSLRINQINLRFDYGLDPDWVSSEIDNANTTVPLPPAMGFFGISIVTMVIAKLKGR